MKSLEQRKKEAVAFIDELSEMNMKKRIEHENGERIAELHNRKYKLKNEEDLKTINK
ncbi:hypothetical protein PM10SUCC1_00320 [Propionigenium maris DSM 9537]|uniref:Uncharacterized protein n=1 Tax=Propionigenium maris DSM 9537 TaxID=1123000 RepID=A0A9W6GI75_9FUSO|nr:hypothetical protein [Propionigenium maris]GLI54517.1 hypothetical protein PM10SUCC1_00320 [Propionigenium maris DSM 9537]